MSKGHLIALAQVTFALLLLAGAATGLEEFGVAIVAGLGFSGILLFAVDRHKLAEARPKGRHLRMVSKIKDEAEAVRRTALFDADLGVYQGWYFELRLREEIDRSRRYGEPVTVLVLKVLPGDLGEENIAR